ncbi:hypothetical protein ACNKHO_18090 [Shigella flexneri]
MTSCLPRSKAPELYRPGTSIQEVTTEVVRIMVTGLQGLGILKGSRPADCR